MRKIALRQPNTASFARFFGATFKTISKSFAPTFCFGFYEIHSKSFGFLAKSKFLPFVNLRLWLLTILKFFCPFASLRARQSLAWQSTKRRQVSPPHCHSEPQAENLFLICEILSTRPLWQSKVRRPTCHCEIWRSQIVAIYDFSNLTALRVSKWWSIAGSNRWPQRCQRCALPAELMPHFKTARLFGAFKVL